MTIKRLDIWLAALDPTVVAEIQKTRPVLVVSNNTNNKHNAVITVLPITSNTAFVADFEVFISKGVGNLPKDSKAKADQIRTLSKDRLIKKIGTLPKTFAEEVKKALQIHLDLE